MTISNHPITVTLRAHRVEVLAKQHNGLTVPKGYANRTQAAVAAAKLGAGWDVWQSHLSRVFFVRKNGRLERITEGTLP